MSIYDQLHQFRSTGGGSSGSSSPSTPSGIDPETSRVKRALFGPVDHEENLRFVQRELARGCREASAKWNYDFENDRPQEGRFQWEIVTAAAAAAAAASRIQCDSADKEQLSVRTALSENRNGPSSSSTCQISGAPPPNTSENKEHEEAKSEPSTSDPPPASSSATKTAKSVPTTGSYGRQGARPKSTPSQRQQSITDHFRNRKRSKSKVKTQERKDSSPTSDSTPTTTTTSSDTKSSSS